MWLPSTPLGMGAEREETRKESEKSEFITKKAVQALRGWLLIGSQDAHHHPTLVETDSAVIRSNTFRC